MFIISFSAAQNVTGVSFREEGLASWYGRGFEGRPTATGEIYDPNLLTAAHRSLPFGTEVTVTNLQNMRQVTVRINDRGPFVDGRVIDISEAAARALDLVQAGIAPVIITSNNVALLSAPMALEPRIEAIIAAPAGPAPSPVQTTPATGVFFPAPPARLTGTIPTTDSNGLYRIQVGAYSVPRNAIDAFDKLINAGLSPNFVQSGDYISVVLAGVRAIDIAQIAQSLGNAGFPEVLVRAEN